ncbi:hypothetical protein Anapl_06938 [Anas platyrhynchos]|uniref:Uncharacterized protein n=1 Tax=Anas platyrhynchos TaxID=8839 RepID=R0LIR7_ANAPL|nr:hypothetical protein Anapl_06938 [Anas platyrhynchos]
MHSEPRQQCEDQKENKMKEDHPAALAGRDLQVFFCFPPQEGKAPVRTKQQTHLKKEQLKMMMNTKGCSESETKAPRGAMSPLLHSMHYKIHAYGLPTEQLIDTMCYC